MLDAGEEIVSTFGVERGEFAEVRSYGQIGGHFLDVEVHPHGIGVVLESSEVCLGLRRVEVGKYFVVERRCLNIIRTAARVYTGWGIHVGRVIHAVGIGRVDPRDNGTDVLGGWG